MPTTIDAQIFWIGLNDASLWEAAYFWHKDGLFSDRQWENWNLTFSVVVPNNLPVAWWQHARPAFTEEFGLHVDAVYDQR